MKRFTGTDKVVTRRNSSLPIELGPQLSSRLDIALSRNIAMQEYSVLNDAAKGNRMIPQKGRLFRRRLTMLWTNLLNVGTLGYCWIIFEREKSRSTSKINRTVTKFLALGCSWTESMYSCCKRTGVHSPLL